MGTVAIAITATALTLEVLLAILLLSRKTQRIFPLFFVYVTYSIIASASQLWVISNYRTFYFVYWSNEAIGVVLSILALWEVFRWVFALFWLRAGFRWLSYSFIALILTLAVANAIRNPPAHMDRTGAIIFSAGITLNFIQAAIFLLFWLLSKSLEIGFRRYAFGIMLGFGVSSSGTLIGWFSRSIFGDRKSTRLNSSHIPL